MASSPASTTASASASGSIGCTTTAATGRLAVPPYGLLLQPRQPFWVPVVIQWNFFLSTHWSVFGEPGLALHYSSWGDGCVSGNYVDVGGGTRYYDCGNAPSRLGVDPFVLFVGGRYHFTEQVALTMRIGWPYASVGVSFFP